MTDVHVPHVSEARLRMHDGLPADRDASEYADFVVIARTSDADVLLWMSVYALTGRGAGQWIVVPEGRMHATIFISAPLSGDHDTLADNDFARTGLHFSQFLSADDHEIDVEATRAEWRIGRRRYVWQPPTWRVVGEHGGVDVDLTFAATAPAQWRWGPYEQLNQNDSAGYEVATIANGSITAGGKTYEIVDGLGFHERPSVGESRDVVRELVGGAEFTTAQIFAPDVKVSLASHSGRQIHMGQVEVGGQSYGFSPLSGQGSAAIDVLERWHDPRSGLLMPSRWHVALVSADAALDLQLAARGRAYFHYLTKAGVMVLVWMLVRADGEFLLADGTRYVLDNALVGARWGRNLLVADEHLEPDDFG